MLAPLLINLAVATVALYLTFNTKEEIVKVAAAFIATASLFLSLFFAPLFIKLFVLTIPLVLGRLRRNGRWQAKAEK